ncbi:ferredoxin [Mycolicibacter nonchromogenicus]|uniref:Ferredoxin n=1 Tax=Mycolicibacter nonchromogenicus TaxID=1782 RepID=A0A1X1ZEQ5_MYCNO|nr:ferredoxin [Mycolicibacter heraklionensis]ORW21819.1 ferredoxin [Mycolicibacter nonchromogenicus]
MKVTVNEDRCVGHGICESIAPDLFAVGDDGLSHVLVDDIGEDRREAAAKAIAACPSQALNSTE